MSEAAFEEALRNAADFMNEERPQLVLLFVWNHFGKLRAKSAKIAKMSRTGLVLSVCYTDQKLSKVADEETASFNFPTPIDDPKNISRVLGTLFNEHSGVCYPDAVMALLMSFVWLLLLFAVATDVDVSRYPFISDFRRFAVNALDPKLASWGLIFLIVAHTFEGLYVAFLCQEKIGIAKSKVVTWIMMTLIMGYPTASKVILLAKMAEKAKKHRKKN